MISEEQIWNYLDGNLNEASRKEIANAIATDKNAAELFEEISALHSSLKTETLMKPSLSFTDAVMASISAAPAYVSAAKPSFKILLFCALPTVAVVLAFCVILASSPVLVSYRLPFQIPVIDFSKFKILFWLADILLLAYFLDSLPEKNRMAGSGYKPF